MTIPWVLCGTSCQRLASSRVNGFFEYESCARLPRWRSTWICSATCSRCMLTPGARLHRNEDDCWTSSNRETDGFRTADWKSTYSTTLCAQASLGQNRWASWFTKMRRRSERLHGSDLDQEPPEYPSCAHHFAVQTFPRIFSTIQQSIQMVFRHFGSVVLGFEAGFTVSETRR